MRWLRWGAASSSVVDGPLVVSNRLAEPNYDVMLAWDPEAMPADWEAGRRREFTPLLRATLRRALLGLGWERL